MVLICVVARSTELIGPDEPPVAIVAARVEPSFETEWHATHRFPSPLSSQGGVGARPPSGKSGRGLPDSQGSVPQSWESGPGWPEFGGKTGDTCPPARSAF